MICRSNCQSDWPNKDHGWCLWCFLWFCFYVGVQGMSHPWSKQSMIRFAFQQKNVDATLVLHLIMVLFCFIIANTLILFVVSGWRRVVNAWTPLHMNFHVGITVTLPWSVFWLFAHQWLDSHTCTQNFPGWLCLVIFPRKQQITLTLTPFIP